MFEIIIGMLIGLTCLMLANKISGHARDFFLRLSEEAKKGNSLLTENEADFVFYLSMFSISVSALAGIAFICFYVYKMTVAVLPT